MIETPQPPGHRLTDDRFARLVEDGAAVFDRLAFGPDAITNLISADPVGARAILHDLRPRARTFLELGSGVGIITIIADLLGYDAYGIEIEPRLVDASSRLADSVGSGATFIEGSFVPPDFQDDMELLNAEFFTVTSGGDAYAEMGLEIRDFDLVYAYPWPDETEWLHALFQRFAAPHAALLSYCARDGYLLTESDGPQ